MIKVYLAGEIHTNWRDKLIDLSISENLDIQFFSPVTDHESSDNCGVEILGDEDKNFWKDNKGANINSIRTKKLIKDSDLVVVKFGEKYKQWNAAFDAGYAAALNKSIIVIHNEDHQHALKEIDAVASAVASNTKQVVRILKYIIQGEL
ncbi:YtoQ family protein [Alphaproteobacteria bacterium]|nr:YtoQ family protein [Alphaproteobacteria bacterium]MDB3863608.1 YtoQ family protein [Alphaproteobacteria bacterium]MDB3973514.1 YtoQ family protein [Alphaproteobacteria bacterium]MDC0968188.1 YtoQ family protein [Alphaproteobacteria bacterium]